MTQRLGSNRFNLVSNPVDLPLMPSSHVAESECGKESFMGICCLALYPLAPRRWVTVHPPNGRTSEDIKMRKRFVEDVSAFYSAAPSSFSCGRPSVVRCMRRQGHPLPSVRPSSCLSARPSFPSNPPFVPLLRNSPPPPPLLHAFDCSPALRLQNICGLARLQPNDSSTAMDPCGSLIAIIALSPWMTTALGLI